jgi:hypothetical protein
MSSRMNYECPPIQPEDELAADPDYTAWSEALTMTARAEQERAIEEVTARHINRLFDRAFGM